MNILNQNQRRSAFLRLLLLNIATVGIMLIVLFAIKTRYSTQGVSEISYLEKSHTKTKTDHQSKLKLTNEKIETLKNDLAECKGSKDDPKLKRCEDRLDRKLATKISRERELKRCSSIIQ